MQSEPQTVTVPQAIQIGVEHHRAGRLAEAELVYQQVLKADPNNPVALNLLGVIAHQVGKHEMSVQLIGRALALKPDYADALSNRGNALQELKRYEEALTDCDRALAIKPDYAEALSNRGNALRGLSRYEEALASYEEALKINPDFVEALSNRGNALHALGRYDEALASYDRALAIKPDYAEALSNRGNALQRLRRYDEALVSLDKALSIKPDFVEALSNRGLALQELKRSDEALVSYDRALSIKPDYADASYNRAQVLLKLQRPAEAMVAYRRALENGGNAEQIEYELAALGTGSAPSAAPTQFVASLFDRYADNFDQHLISTLKYQTPNLLFEQITRFCPSHDLDILDLGCGTGLLGPLLRPLARTLTGVDLSANMLEKASQRHVYDNLVRSDLTRYLETKNNSFDLAVAADVFVYMGDLAGVFASLKDALRLCGWFSFSIEANDGGDFVLKPTRRYGHSVAYCEKLASDHGFVIASIEPGVIRQENGADVNGYLALMHRS